MKFALRNLYLLSFNFGISLVRFEHITSSVLQVIMEELELTDLIGQYKLASSILILWLEEIYLNTVLWFVGTILPGTYVELWLEELIRLTIIWYPDRLLQMNKH